MADIRSPRVPLTVQLPVELVEEIKTSAREKQLSVDDLVMEACLEFTEPILWGMDYRKSLQGRQDEVGIQHEQAHKPSEKESV